MISAGNDIIALSRINKERTNQRNYYSKILSNTEQMLYHDQDTGLPFENYVWLLWSVKESVYKFLKRILPDLIFSPTKIIINKIRLSSTGLMVFSEKINTENACDGLDYEGTVTLEPYNLYFHAKIDDQMIVSVVNDTENFNNVWCAVGLTENTSYEHQSRAAKDVLLRRLNTLLPGCLEIEKSPIGYPVITANNRPVNIAASLAHDGRFVACSINLASLV